ncbi:MAG: murein hydrolase activator EnvC [Mangrovibacterium sp.]
MILFTAGLLDETRESEKISLDRLNLVANQVGNRKELIGNLQAELQLLDQFIIQNTEVLYMFRTDLESLKDEYAKLIRLAAKQGGSTELLVFLLSSVSFNQAYRRLLYLKEYTRYRKSQVELIIDLKELIEAKAEDLEKQRGRKLKLMAGIREETRLLEQEMREQGLNLNALRQKQYYLIRKLREQEKVREELDLAIERLILEGKIGKSDWFGVSPGQEMLAADFEKNKGRIPWPVENGVITEKFGVHPHPVLRQLTVKNNGIDIATESGSRVRAVFAGEVSRVFAISGGNMAVIIRHGAFLTVYSNLSEVWVSAGEKVAVKQEIGTIFTDQTGGNKTILKFQIWKENQKLDPQDWISH